MHGVIDPCAIECTVDVQCGAVGKGILRRLAQPGIYLNGLQSGAVRKRLAADGHGGLRDHDLRQLGAAFECPIANRHHSIRQLHGAQILQIAENVVSKGGKVALQDDPVYPRSLISPWPTVFGKVQFSLAGDGHDACAAEHPGRSVAQRTVRDRSGGNVDGIAVPGAVGAVIQRRGDPGGRVGDGIKGKLGAVLESIVSGNRRRAVEIGGGQSAAPPKGVAADLRHTGGDRNGTQSAAAIESVAADLGKAAGECDRGQRTAAVKGVVQDQGDAVGDGDRGQGRAAFKGIGEDLRHTVRNGDGGQAGTLTKSPFSDFCNPAGNRERGKRVTIVEGGSADPRHGVGNGDGGQVTLLIEGIIADGGRAAFKHYLFDAARNTAPRGAGGVIVIHSAVAADD